MNKQRIAIIIACILGIISVFLPWMEHPFRGTVTGFHPRIPFGKIALLLFIIPLVLTFLKDRSKALTGGLLYGAIAGGVISAIMGIMAINTFSKEIMAHIGMGLYLLVLAGFSIPAIGFLVKDKE